MIIFLILSVLILIIGFYLIKKRIKRNAKVIKPSENVTATDDNLDDYFSISFTNGGRITNAYGKTISYCVPKKDNDENKSIS